MNRSVIRESRREVVLLLMLAIRTFCENVEVVFASEKEPSFRVERRVRKLRRSLSATFVSSRLPNSTRRLVRAQRISTGPP